MIDLNNVVNTYDVTTINDNFDTVATELNNNVLYRNPPDGKPNEMLANVDMNGNRILNLPAPIGDNEPVRKIDFQNQFTPTLSPLADATGSTLVGYQDKAAASTVSVQLDILTSGIFNVANPKYAGGAKLDGITNDTDAFVACAADLQAAGGGVFYIPPGSVALVGKQVFANGTGKGYAYQGTDIISIANCTKPVIIQGNGCRMKAASGLRFGSFDPITGLPNAPAMPNTNQNYGADVGTMVYLHNNVKVAVLNIEMDGNAAQLVLGGQWGDTGYQRLAYGIRCYTNENTHIEDVYSHHHGTDGVIIGYNGATADMEDRPVTLINVRCDYNSRQGCSWVGGSGLTAIGCKFTNTGKGTFSSAPGAGLDIEAESATIRRGVFINCEFANNSGCAMVADSGDSADLLFKGCRFYGMTQVAIWPKKPRITFEDCLIAGGAFNSYNATDEGDRTKFIRCKFSADEVWNGLAATYQTALADFTSQNPIFNSCSFVTHAVGVKLIITNQATFIDCNFTQNGSVSGSLVRGTFQGRNLFTVSTGSNDFSGSLNYGEILYNGSPISMGSSSQYYATVNYIASNNIIFQTNKVGFGWRAPVGGTYTRGDIVYNNTLSAGGVEFWKCTASGTPGTWVANRKRGTFTCSANTLTTVPDTDVQTTSVIVLMPKNAPAATLMGGATSLYVSARTAGTSFALNTANGVAALGTEQFEYVLNN